MKLLTDLISHLLLFGLVASACFFVFVFLLGGISFIFKILWAVCYPVYLISLKPFIWGMTTIFNSRCPECGGFLEKRLVNFEIADKRESLRTINRVDQGVLYSNHLFALNQGFEIRRQEQVMFVEQTLLNHWECKNSACGHQWETEEYQEWEGSKD